MIVLNLFKDSRLETHKAIHKLITRTYEDLTIYGKIMFKTQNCCSYFYHLLDFCLKIKSLREINDIIGTCLAEGRG